MKTTVGDFWTVVLLAQKHRATYLQKWGWIAHTNESRDNLLVHAWNVINNPSTPRRVDPYEGKS